MRFQNDQNQQIDDIMYRLYVIDKIKKGQDAIHDGKTISVEDLKEEILHDIIDMIDK